MRTRGVEASEMRCRPARIETAGNRSGEDLFVDVDLDAALRDAWLISRFTGSAAGTPEDARRLVTGDVARNQAPSIRRHPADICQWRQRDCHEEERQDRGPGVHDTWYLCIQNARASVCEQPQMTEDIAVDRTPQRAFPHRSQVSHVNCERWVTVLQASIDDIRDAARVPRRSARSFML